MEAAVSQLHLVFLWLFGLWLGGAGVTTFRLPFLGLPRELAGIWDQGRGVHADREGHFELQASIAVWVNTAIDCTATGAFQLYGRSGHGSA